jgi:hypothetical protein
VLEDVAVEEVELLALEAVVEVDGDLNGVPGLDEHGVLPAEVRSGPAMLVHREVRDLLGAAGPSQNQEPERVQVHGAGHAALLVADLPDSTSLLRATMRYSFGSYVRLAISHHVSSPSASTKSITRRVLSPRSNPAWNLGDSLGHPRRRVTHTAVRSLLHHQPEHVELLPARTLLFIVLAGLEVFFAETEAPGSDLSSPSPPTPEDFQRFRALGRKCETKYPPVPS